MTDYTELVKALRHLSTGRCDVLHGCEPCAIYETCLTRCVLDAAAAIEDLQDTVQAQDKALKECALQLAKMGPKRVEIVRCKDCDSWDTEQSSGRKSLGNYVCICQEWSDGEDARWVYTGENEYCSRGEPKEKMEVQG